MIKINENYSINTSRDGCSLVAVHTKQKEEVVDKVKTGKIVDYVVKDIYYYSTVEQCLNKFLSLEIEDVESIEGILMKIQEVKLLIKDLTNLQK